MTFNLNETSFSEKFAIWRYLTSKSSKKKIAQIENFGHFLDFPSLLFNDFAHNDRWAQCLVVFLPFAGPVNLFLFGKSSTLKHLIFIFIFIFKLFKSATETQKTVYESANDELN